MCCYVHAMYRLSGELERAYVSLLRASTVRREFVSVDEARAHLLPFALFADPTLLSPPIGAHHTASDAESHSIHTGMSRGTLLSVDIQHILQGFSRLCKRFSRVC